VRPALTRAQQKKSEARSRGPHSGVQVRSVED
jgi:hypothetical protein